MNISRQSLYLIAVLLVLLLVKTDLATAANTGSQIISTQLQQDISSQKDRAIKDKLYRSKQQKKSEQGATIEEGNAGIVTKSNEEFYVDRIDVQGVSLLKSADIDQVTVNYEKRKLTLPEVQKAADLITDLYRKKGFITSRAYLPPQTIKDGVLVIQVVEGKLGKVEIRGNRYFKTSLLKRELHLTHDGYFDYAALQSSLVYLNQHPDRMARTVLSPGTEPGTTDVLVNVKDRLPIHAGFIYDNYGSRYIDSNRYALTLEDNNLLGFDDRMYAKVQTSNSNYMRFGQLQYVVPVTETLNIGAYGIYSKLRLTKQFAALEATGEAKVLGLFFDKALVQDAGIEWRLNGGFDYKNISNNILGTLISRDKERVAKLGTQLDITDRFGRTIIDPEINVGLPSILGGMDPRDGLASRAGSGGSFQKGVISLYRLQPMPFSTSILWKNYGQWSHSNLPAAEEFELGGPNSVRGYGPAEYSGDKGFYSGLDWSVPPYFIPESVKLPFTQERLKDSLRFVAFYDMGFAHLNSVAVGEEKNVTLRSYGYGIRLNVKDNLSVRLEVGYPIGRKPSDGSNAHPWVEVTMKF